MSFTSLLCYMRRMVISTPIVSSVRSLKTADQLHLKFSLPLCGEPLKKKKRLDPAIVRAREERRKRKLEKQIRRLEKNALQLKPIDECEVPLTLRDEMDKRLRPPVQIPEDIQIKRTLLCRQWTEYKRKQHLDDVKLLDRMTFAQQKALDELRIESEDLYQAAIQIDSQLLPITMIGPVDTPPIDNYLSPDGDYADISKKWE